MRLYVIGNGFDIYHGLNTHYLSFGLYLKKHHREVYELLLEHYGFCDLEPNANYTSDLLWSDFETSLSKLDKENVLDSCSNFLPDYSSDEFRDRDRYAFAMEVAATLEKLTVDLYKAFKFFILSVNFPDLDKVNKVNLEKNAIYLNFNYTDTLKIYYGIPDENVIFIHGKAECADSSLILGHGIDPENFKEKPVSPPENLSDEEYEEWRQSMSDQYDHSYELGKDEVSQYFTKTFKGTGENINKNTRFFNSLGNVDEVYILGHSLAEVDLPYFKELAKVIKPESKWVATYYEPDDQEKHFNTLNKLGIKNVSIIKMEEV